MSKRFLFLDDNPARHQTFDMMVIGCDVKHVWTAQQCMDALAQDEPYDCVFLDHDLGGLELVGQEQSEKGHGTEVAQFFLKSLPPENYPKRVVIHSWNPEGAKRMESLISQTGVEVNRIPFGFPG